MAREGETHPGCDIVGRLPVEASAKITSLIAELDMLAHVVEENAVALQAAANELDVHEKPAPAVAS